MDIVIIDISPIAQMVGMFDIARNRLGDGNEVLGIIYDGDHVPKPLRDIMQSFLMGEATHDETVAQLDDCAEKLNRLLPELLLIKPTRQKKVSRYERLLMDTTWKGSVVRKWHDRVVRIRLFFTSLLRGELQKKWDDIRRPNPAKYI